MTAVEDTVLDILGNIISYPTVTGRMDREEAFAGLAGYFKDYFEGHGCIVQLIKNPAENEPGTSVIASYYPPGTSPETPGIMISGHLDVVETDDQKWRADPFTMIIVGDDVIGRGACDMSGSEACAMAALPHWIANNSFGVPIHFVFTDDEERGGAHCGKIMAEWENYIPAKPVCAYVIEPTDLRPMIAHKGMIRRDYDIHGITCHSSRPDDGVDAEAAYVYAYQSLEDAFEVILDQTKPNSDFKPSLPTKNVLATSPLRAGNSVPGKASFYLQIRTLPGQNFGDLLTFVDSALAPVTSRMEKQRIERKLDLPADFGLKLVKENNTGGFAISTDHPLVQSLLHVTGTTEVKTSSGGTDARHIAPHGIPVVVFGAGDVSQAHRPDEKITKKELSAGYHFFRDTFPKAANMFLKPDMRAGIPQIIPTITQ